jgi:DNA-binding IclR family transcriptional regulator
VQTVNSVDRLRESLWYGAPGPRYSTGPAVVRLAATTTNRCDLLPIASPSVTRLAELTAETAAIHARSGCDSAVTDSRYYPPRRCLSVALSPTTLGPCWHGAMNRRFRAASAGRAVKSDPPTALETLEAQLSRIRSEGTMRFGETVASAAALAALSTSRGTAGFEWE